MRSLPIRIGHSPDPDDAFLFYALTHGKLGLPGLQVTHVLEGIEELNRRALEGELEMTAISLHAYPYCAQRYVILTTGSSVGDGYGPILVAKRPMSLEEIKRVKVAIPGKLTTAALLLQLAMGPVRPRSNGVGRLDLTVLPFDQILPAVAKGEIEAGVLIHEGQLTYGNNGLQKVLDLGEWWKKETGLPVPLGINVIRRDLGAERIALLAAAFKQSLDFAFAHRTESLVYAQQFSRGLDLAQTDRFVGMYVNRWSLDCRPEGAAAMQKLLDWAAGEGLTPRRVPVEFVE